MILYRFCQKQYIATAWSGVGAFNSSVARWNRMGTPMVYISSAVSLAILEVLVHLQDESILDFYQLMSIDVPDDFIVMLNAQDLPANWNAPVPIPATKDIGTQWFQGKSSVGLMVPSAIVPMEYNVLINNEHPAFAGCLASVTPLEFTFDPRLNPSL
ncbi:RES family NAD+ phosphorylase [Sodalis sp. RH24]|uniref:RES family NAD+ phosphorylase n=1 Tax=unclassified Sodalis (in: enterobacteria) TaxID=2636512 RepID=UPI0039B6E86A